MYYHTKCFHRFFQDQPWIGQDEFGAHNMSLSYKSTVGRLKALRTEIEHLQLLLERAKVKLQRDFQKWWSQESSSVQVTDLTFPCLSIWQHHINLL